MWNKLRQASGCDPANVNDELGYFLDGLHHCSSVLAPTHFESSLGMYFFTCINVADLYTAFRKIKSNASDVDGITSRFLEIVFLE